MSHCLGPETEKSWILGEKMERGAKNGNDIRLTLNRCAVRDKNLLIFSLWEHFQFRDYFREKVFYRKHLNHQPFSWNSSKSNRITAEFFIFYFNANIFFQFISLIKYQSEVHYLSTKLSSFNLTFFRFCFQFCKYCYFSLFSSM